MEGGCKTVPWIKSLKSGDKARYKEICHTIREAGAFVEAGENDNLIMHKLVANPSAFGIFGFSFLDQNAELVKGAPTDGTEPAFDAVVRNAMLKQFPDAGGRRDRRALLQLVSAGAAYKLCDVLADEPSLMESRQTVFVPASSNVDMLIKGNMDRNTDESRRRLSDQQIAWVDILLDEPCSALDPIATARIEDLIDELSENYVIVIVTHSMQQAARVSQRVAYFHLGSLVEVDDTNKIFTNPSHKLTEDYITGRFG
jgi:hypothetical protein